MTPAARPVDGGMTWVILRLMKTAISLPDELFQACERLAREMGVSRSELVQRALTAFLRERDPKQITQALNKVYGPGSDSSVDPILLKMQLASLVKEDW